MSRRELRLPSSRALARRGRRGSVAAAMDAAELRLPAKGRGRRGETEAPILDSLHDVVEDDEAELAVASTLPGRAPIAGVSSEKRARLRPI